MTPISRPGFGPYASTLREGFKASNTYEIDARQHSDRQTQSQ